MNTPVVGVVRDGDWNIVQAAQQTGHFPGTVPQSNSMDFVLMFVLLLLVVFRPTPKRGRS